MKVISDVNELRKMLAFAEANNVCFMQEDRDYWDARIVELRRLVSLGVD